MGVNKYQAMKNKGDWIGIAFKTGSFRYLQDDAIMGLTFGEFVHCEVVIGNDENGKAYGAFQGPGGGGFMPSDNKHVPPEWALFTMPLKKPTQTRGVLLHMLTLNLPYNYADLWQCCISTLLPWETELDCDKPESWRKGVFCSQAALLVLRRLARMDAIECPSDTRRLLEAFHSRGCSPNALFGLLNRETKRVF